MPFKALGLEDLLLKAIAEKGYTEPTPIQAQAIPPVLAGRDMLGIAQTGTGKTAAFALPILQRLAAHKATGAHRPIRCLVLSPTRELAAQIGQSFHDYGKHTGIRHTVIFGGVGQNPQVDAVRRGVDVLVATPGRLLDLIGQGFIKLDKVETFVLDEADQMLDMGFIHDVKRVIKLLPARRQNLLFSATMPSDIAVLADNLLHERVVVQVAPQSTVAERIEQRLFFVEHGDKKHLLTELLHDGIDGIHLDRALVFTRTKHGANKLAKALVGAKISAEAIHGNKSQSARTAALKGFKDGRVQVLVATDIAARGLDISALDYVVNYDLSDVAETFVHRIGRTARAGASGVAVAFCAPDEAENWVAIERLMTAPIPRAQDHRFHSAAAAAAVDREAARRNAGGRAPARRPSGGGRPQHGRNDRTPRPQGAHGERPQHARPHAPREERPRRDDDRLAQPPRETRAGEAPRERGRDLLAGARDGPQQGQHRGAPRSGDRQSGNRGRR